MVDHYPRAREAAQAREALADLTLKIQRAMTDTDR
jgi:hypothetical protein